MQDTTDRIHTLASIAEGAGVQKRAVQRWLSKHNTTLGGEDIGEIQGSTRYFSDAERDILLSYQSKRHLNDSRNAMSSKAPDTVDEFDTTPTTPSDTPITPTSITVIEGNHRNTLATPQFPTEFNLGSMRSELATVESHDDPLALAEQFINGADSLMDAMSQDEKAMAQKIAKTRQARTAVGRKVDQLKRRNDIYSLRTELLADRQNVETAALNGDFEVLQSMGKQPGA